MSAKWGEEMSAYKASYVWYKLYQKLTGSQAINYGVLKSRFVGATGDITVSWSAVKSPSDNS